MRVLVTGANGFIGSALVSALAGKGAVVRAACRSRQAELPANIELVNIGDLGPHTDWEEALAGIEQVVHLGGPAHGAGDFERAIVAATRRLAQAARQAGVRRFIFISSIKAAADQTSDRGVTEADEARPQTDYGAAKLAAEAAVADLFSSQYVVLRPPLVFAPNAKANFARLLRLAGSGIPLPLSDIENKRSLISLPSFVEALEKVLTTPETHAGVFHVAGAPPLSSAQMIGALRHGMTKPARLFRSEALAALLPSQLKQSLVIDDHRFREAYGWDGGRDVVAELVSCGRLWKRAQ